jgi:hypothetical protein
VTVRYASVAGIPVTYYAPAALVTQMVEAILLDRKRVLAVFGMPAGRI